MTPDPDDLAPGDRVGRFEIVAKLGQGGMGVVYRALEVNLGREVALKVITPIFAHDLEFRERFTREARSQASLSSTHVVTVYAHGEEDGYLYLASQLVPGGDLGDLLRTSGTPSMVEALDLVEQVASGLADAHRAGLVHRDIKPGNVLVGRGAGPMRAYLADFGIARQMNADATRFSTVTPGTPSYMAPELHGGAKAGPATDIYALGCVLWVTLTGAPPYAGANGFEMIAAHVQAPIPQLAGEGAMVHAVNRVLRTALAKDPVERYSTAAEMRADLQAALRLPATPGAAAPADPAATVVRPAVPKRPAPAPTPAPASPVVSRPPMPAPPVASPQPVAPPPSYLTAATPSTALARRRPWAAVIAAVVLLALVVGVGLVVLLTRDGDDPVADDEFLDLSAAEIVRASTKDMAVVDAARVKGTFANDGDLVTIDVVATSKGDCQGTLRSKKSGGTAEILRVGGHFYLRPDRAYWAAYSDAQTAAVLLTLIGDRWVQEDSIVEGSDNFCDLDELLERDGREDAEATKVGESEVGGVETVQIELATDSQSETLDISVAEPHYLLRVDEGGDNVFEFSEFDATDPIEPPARGDAVPLSDYLDLIGRGLDLLPSAEPTP